MRSDRYSRRPSASANSFAGACGSDDGADAAATMVTGRMNVLMVTRYDVSGASSRLRLLQYRPALAAAGIAADVIPFFSEAYLDRLYAGRSTRTEALGAYARRVRELRSARAFDLLWLEKEALPWLPWAIERRLLPRGVPLVADFDDAVFHNYDLHGSGAVRRILGDKIDRLMAGAALITAGNAYLAERARAAGASRVEIVPTVVDLDTYRMAPAPAAGEPARIGWIGTPSTWNAYVVPMLPLLTRAAAEAGARILAVGGGQVGGPHPLLDMEPWSEAAEVPLIHRMSIGIMPLDDTPWARGKCGYKLIQYMACGLPVVASPVGVNTEIVEHGVDGFLARTPEEWHAAISTLLADPDLRQRMGAAGRRKIETHYALGTWGPRVAAMLQAVAGQGNRP